MEGRGAADERDRLATNGDRHVRASARSLVAVFRISTSSHCPAAALDGMVTVRDVTTNDGECAVEIDAEAVDATCEDIVSSGGVCECSSESERQTGNGRMRLTTTRAEECLCAIFTEHDCTPTISEMGHGDLLVETTLPDREAISPLVADLRSVAGSVRIKQLKDVSPSSGAGGDWTAVDRGRLTDAQRAFLSTAIELGYFEDPRGITATELADHFDITPSAVSRRLRRIQAKIFGQIDG
ncbi:MAG: helix-turn-helix domain-containing protein [Halobacteriota archaeon]